MNKIARELKFIARDLSFTSEIKIFSGEEIIDKLVTDTFLFMLSRKYQNVKKQIRGDKATLMCLMTNKTRGTGMADFVVNQKVVVKLSYNPTRKSVIYIINCGIKNKIGSIPLKRDDYFHGLSNNNDLTSSLLDLPESYVDLMGFKN